MKWRKKMDNKCRVEVETEAHQRLIEMEELEHELLDRIEGYDRITKEKIEALYKREAAILSGVK